MATAVVEERQLLNSLRWWDGFVIALQCLLGEIVSDAVAHKARCDVLIAH